ncbi:MAG: ribokinase, partial [Chthoniobacteraceae bacterium]
MPKKSIVVIGSSNTDMVVNVARIPRPGETILGGKFHTAPGGKGANQAVAAQRAGGDVTFIASVGHDAFGAQAVAGFAKEGINTAHISRDKSQPSGVALIFVGADGENSIAVASGANSRLSRANIEKAAKVISRASVLVMQLETPLPAIQFAAKLAAAKKIPVILNPAPARSLPDALLRQITILTPNETETETEAEAEAEILTGIKVTDTASAIMAANALFARGVCIVIITLGARGALIATTGLVQHIPGFKVKPVDTTAAGDCFNGALAVAFAEGKLLPDAVRFANAAAALSVTKRGAQPSAPTRRA